MWTANETAWVSATLNKAAGRDDNDCSMCETMWDATCFDTRVHGLDMRGLTERCGGKLHAATPGRGVLRTSTRSTLNLILLLRASV